MNCAKKISRLLFDASYRFDYLSRCGFLNRMGDEKYLKRKYFLKQNKKLNLDSPKTYNEKLQWLKLHDRRKEYIKMVDKIGAKEYVASIVGEKYIIPTLGVYKRFEDINFDKLPNQFVIKCSHDSGGLVVVRDKAKMDIEKTRKKINKSLKRNYYYASREWPYKYVEPRILVEEYIDVNNKKNSTGLGGGTATSTERIQSKNGLLDYKFMCFNGVVKCLFLDIGVIGEGTGHAEYYYRNVYNRNFKLLPFLETRENYPEKITPPENYKEMIAVAEKLSKGIPHVRIDLYNVNGRILFGEMTFFHGGGLTNYFRPEEWDAKLGDWIDLGLAKEEMK